MSNLTFSGVRKGTGCNFDLVFTPADSSVTPPKIGFTVNHECRKNTWPTSWFYKKCSNYPEIVNVSPNIEKGLFGRGKLSFRASLRVKEVKKYKDRSHYCQLITLTYKIWEHEDIVPVGPFDGGGNLRAAGGLVDAGFDVGAVPDYSGDVIIKVCCGTCHEERRAEAGQECCGTCEVYYPK